MEASETSSKDGALVKQEIESNVTAGTFSTADQSGVPSRDKDDSGVRLLTDAEAFESQAMQDHRTILLDEEEHSALEILNQVILQERGQDGESNERERTQFGLPESLLGRGQLARTVSGCDNQSTVSTSALPDPIPALKAEVISSEAKSTTAIDEVANAPSIDSSEGVADEYIRSPEVQNAIVERSPGGRYVRFMEKLGSGASKDVYRAYDTQEGIEVAWNVVSLAGVPKAERNRIVNEVRLLERLHHHNIISFHGSWVNRERQEVNFVTEILSSGTLKSFINKVQFIRWKIAKRWAVQILNGLDYLHSQDPPVIHRDLKCDNVFINGTSGDLRIGDFGLSTVHRGGRALSVLGTPEFMAPDMYEESPYDEKVDIYAFGMCMLEIFTKEIPYSECNNPAQIYKKVSNGEPPEVLKRLQSKHARDFILLCLGYKDESGKYVRPSAAELLTHPFLVKRSNDDDEVVVDPPLRERVIAEGAGESSSSPSGIQTPRRQHLSESVSQPSSSHHQQHAGEIAGSSAEPASTPPQLHHRNTSNLSTDEYDGDEFEEMPESETNMRKVKVLMGRGHELKEDEEQATSGSDELLPDLVGANRPALDQSMAPPPPAAKMQYLVAAAVIENESQNVRPYADDILKLVIALPVEGQTQNVQFDFHLVQDDPVKVAKEMVQELGIPEEAVLEISGTISGLACSARMKQDRYAVRLKEAQAHSVVQHQGTAQSGPQGAAANSLNLSEPAVHSTGSISNDVHLTVHQPPYNPHGTSTVASLDNSATQHIAAHPIAFPSELHQPQFATPRIGAVSPPSHLPQVFPVIHGGQSTPHVPFGVISLNPGVSLSSGGVQSNPLYLPSMQAPGISNSSPAAPVLSTSHTLPTSATTGSNPSSQTYRGSLPAGASSNPHAVAPIAAVNPGIPAALSTMSNQSLPSVLEVASASALQPPIPATAIPVRLSLPGIDSGQPHQSYVAPLSGPAAISQPHLQPSLPVVVDNGAQSSNAHSAPLPGPASLYPSTHSQSSAPMTGFQQTCVGGALSPSEENPAVAIQQSSMASVGQMNSSQPHSIADPSSSLPTVSTTIPVPSAQHGTEHAVYPVMNGSATSSLGGMESDDDGLDDEVRQLEEDFQRNLQRAMKVFDNRMDNLQRSQIEREAQHQKTLEKHQKERAEFEKRLAQEEEQQLRRIEQLRLDLDKRKESLASKRKIPAQRNYDDVNGIHGSSEHAKEPAPSGAPRPLNGIGHPSSTSAATLASMEPDLLEFQHMHDLNGSHNG